MTGHFQAWESPPPRLIEPTVKHSGSPVAITPAPLTKRAPVTTLFKRRKTSWMFGAIYSVKCASSGRNSNRVLPPPGPPEDQEASVTGCRDAHAGLVNQFDAARTVLAHRGKRRVESTRAAERRNRRTGPRWRPASCPRPAPGQSESDRRDPCVEYSSRPRSGHGGC